MHSRKPLIIFSLIILCFIAEVFCSTFFIKPLDDILKVSGEKTFYTLNNNNLVSILYFIGGIGIALLPLINVKGKLKPIAPKTHLIAVFLIGIIVIYLFMLGTHNMILLFNTDPVNKREADMLPIMRVLNERLLSNQKLYAPIPSVWNEYPVYMPAMWLPFMPSIIASIDMRWTTLTLLTAGVLLILFKIPRKAWQWNTLFALLPLCTLLYFIFIYDTSLLHFTEESIVIFYYLLLGVAIISGNPLFIAICITLCGFSRFAFLGWLLFFIPFIFFTISKKKALLILGYTVTFSLILLIATRSISNFWFFFNTRHYYLNNFYDPRNTDSYKELVIMGVGLAKFFPFNSLTTLLNIQYGVTLLFPVIAFFIYKRFKTVDTNWLLLCLLKLDLVLFYNCLIMPWGYLFYPSTFLSAFIVVQYMVRQLKDDAPENVLLQAPV